MKNNIHPTAIVSEKATLVGKNINDISRVKQIDEILDDDLILDIGPSTVNTIKKIILSLYMSDWLLRTPDFSDPTIG